MSSSQSESENENENVNKKISDDEISRNARKTYVETEVKDKVVKYLKIDDIIREQKAVLRNNLKELNEQKQGLEKFILRYLDDVQEDVEGEKKFLDYGKGKLVKNIKKTPEPIKPENVKESVSTTLKKEFNDDERVSKLLDEILTNIQSKRKIKESISLVRTFNKEPKEKISRKKEKEKVELEDLDDIPEFKEYKKKKERK